MTGDQSLLKRINRMALVRLVKAEPGLSRVDLANRTGLTKTTVGMQVQELIDEGWLRQNAPAKGSGWAAAPCRSPSIRTGSACWGPRLASTTSTS